LPQNHFREQVWDYLSLKVLLKHITITFGREIWTDDVVEFKGKYHTIPASKIGPKLIHKLHIPIYLGGFSSKTFKRIVNFDLDGWLATIGGPLEYLDKSIKDLRGYTEKAKKMPTNLRSSH